MVRFGPFDIDARTWTLRREGQAVDLSPRLVQILAHLIERDGDIVTKEELLERFWPDTFVAENTLTRAIADIRKALHDAPGRPTVIQTIARRGYRFIGTRQAGEPPLEAFRHWVSGKLALESLDPARLAEARAAMEAAAAAMPDYAPAHAGVANAGVAAFERTRIRNHPDWTTLAAATAAARRACEIDPSYAEGWAVLAHARSLDGDILDAEASARRAISLEPGNWRHHYRLALASWGEARIRAAATACARCCRPVRPPTSCRAWSSPRAARGHRLVPRPTRARPCRMHRRLAYRCLPRACTGCARSWPWPMATSALPGGNWLASSTAPSLYGAEFGWLALTHGCLELADGRTGDARAAFEQAMGLNAGAARTVLGLHRPAGCPPRAWTRRSTNCDLA
ncbi:MAG: winged helix-turn-helix domain-containing protein [Vicinamibacterales bacterium]